MPIEKVTRMGIQISSLPDEQEREKDEQFLSLIIKFLNDEQREIVKTLLGEDYYNKKMLKAEKVIAIYNNGGTKNLSELPGSTTPDVIMKRV